MHHTESAAAPLKQQRFPTSDTHVGRRQLTTTEVYMRRATTVLGVLAFSTALIGLSSPAALAQPHAATPLVQFDLMTWPELKEALAAGKTTALLYTGGIEERGPQNATGGHNLMAEGIVKAVALKLGNAIAMPVLPYTPNKASPDMPGTIGLSNDVFAAVLEELTEETIVNGFKNVVIMGDHGGGQPDVYVAVAKKLNDKYASQGIHVYYCDAIYKANDEFDKELAKEGYPGSLHGGIPDTSMMMYLGGNNDVWVRRNLVKTALGDPPLPRGTQPGAGTPRINNGIIGDARRSTAALGKRLFDMKIDAAVKQIHEFIPPR
jgi:creatinine amidohydrolase